ncbi:NAD(P)H-binding protein [Roseospirillum parvum]|uniref:Uncharacterized conserved protein YbjT, contains NAD(P)-binding and DUF2867 domains n=1 Tax=Roseospirillum parvum TaxID=83401 RepID=A0A1G8ALM7_9PROT|nr:NAD(P)H-binding protein [Roseospirillum parvum]SDH21861.1 Uncharacterized conserved protein YbjT, contains NAD(P)-binding and DUF2867 domains [Roseospirillum parvum]
MARPRTRFGHLLLCGATRGTGLEVARLARARGITVHALVRPGADTARLDTLGCHLVPGDVLDPPSLQALIAAAPAETPCVSTLGGGPGDSTVDDQGVGNVAEALAASGPPGRRLIMVSSLGAGDSRAHASQRLLDAIGPVLEAKTRGEDRARAVDLGLTVLRPGGLLDQSATGRGALFVDQRVHGRIARAELARLILACLGTPETIGRTLAAIDADTLSAPETVEPFPLAED